MTQIGAIAKLTKTPAKIVRGAPKVGEHTRELLSEASRVGEASIVPAASLDAAGPLDGVTILDLSMIIAAPLGVSMLADLGARVIKIEPHEGDPFRFLVPEGALAVKMNAGKESIAINLKKEEGQAILREFVAKADVIVHNLRAGVPEKLGLSYEQVRAIQPGIIWAVVNGYGRDGPSSSRPATHPVIGAATGGVAYQAGEALTRDCESLEEIREAARQIMCANESNPDPNTSVVAASAILLALFERARSGEGQRVHIDMQVANAWANADDFLDYAGKPTRTPIDPELHGIGACYRLYSTSDGWVFLAVTTDTEFDRFCKAAERSELASDERFSSVRARAENSDALVEELAVLFAKNDANSWEERFTRAGVGCVRADGIDSGRVWLQDPQVVANGWVPVARHARFGSIRRWGPVVTVGGLQPSYRSSPIQGEHTDALLRELGKDDVEIQRLRDSQIVTSGEV